MPPHEICPTPLCLVHIYDEFMDWDKYFLLFWSRFGVSHLNMDLVCALLHPSIPLCSHRLYFCIEIYFITKYYGSRLVLNYQRFQLFYFLNKVYDS
jgi:hypothetical protein